MGDNFRPDLQEDPPEEHEAHVVHQGGEAPEMNNRENAVNDLEMMEIDGVRMIVIRGQPGENHRRIAVPIPLHPRDLSGAVSQMAANRGQWTAPNTRVLRSAGNENGMEAAEESNAGSDKEPVRRGRRRSGIVLAGSFRRGLRRLRCGLVAPAICRRGRDQLAGSVGRRHPRGGLVASALRRRGRDQSAGSDRRHSRGGSVATARHGRIRGGAQVNRDESSDSDGDPDEEPDRGGRRRLGGVSQNRRALPNELRGLRYGFLGVQQDGLGRHGRRRLRDVSTDSEDRVQRRRPRVNVTAGPAARRRRGALSNELRGLRYGTLGAQQDRVGRHGRHGRRGRRGQAAGGASRGGHHAIGRRASRGRLAAQRGRAGAATRGSGRSGGE